uniref:C-type lectin domain-containing protein n=1 Tax=Amphilophus citrinellus TaxID=61819 RepID=A0A3Q0RD19_AMPCI
AGRLFFCALWLNTKTQNTPMCLPGWRRFKSGCYQLSSTSNTWEFARQDCEGSGAHLVILTDKAEEVFVIYVHINFSCAEKFWIGLKAEDTSDTCVCTWTWVDGSSLCYRGWIKPFRNQNCIGCRTMFKLDFPPY